MEEAWIIDACRAPRGIGKSDRGALADIHPQRLGGAVLRALAKRTGVKTSDIDDVVWGTSGQRDAQGEDLARMSLLDAEYDVRASGVTIDRFCGSGVSAAIMAASSIMSGMEDLVVAGGTELMSMPGRRGDGGLWDHGNLHLRSIHPQAAQGMCADALATMEKISREDCDDFAFISHQRTRRAISDGHFAKSLIPIFHDDGRLALDHEQYPRPQTTREGLAALRPSFEAIADKPLDDTGTTHRSLFLKKYPDVDIEFVHHAGNSSGLADGSAAILLASSTYAKANGLKPRARILATANMGDCPTLMFNAVAPSTQKVLAKAGLALSDIDLFEVNEAFAVVPIKFMRDLGVDHDRLNVNGGAIGLGHPIGATGPILIGTLLDEMERRGVRRGLVVICAGGGMAPSIIIERMD